MLIGKLLQRREVKFLAIILAMLSSGSVVRAAVSVTLAWDSSSDTNVLGYVLYNGVTDKSYINNTDVGNQTSVTLTNVLEGVVNFFFVTAYDSNGVESVPSNLIGTNFPGTYPFPTISAIPDYHIDENSSVGPIFLTNGDASFIPASLDDLNILVTSSNPTLVPDGNILLGGSGSNRTMTVVPAIDKVGSAIITYAASDGISNARTSFRLTVTPTVPSRFVYRTIEAESAALVSPMAVASDPNASQAQFIESSADELGTATFTVDIPVFGVYSIWCQVLSANDSQDSFYVSVDGGAEDIYDTAQGTWTNAWQWTVLNGRGGTNSADLLAINPRTFLLSAGPHNITFRGREARTGFDQMLVTNDPDFVPGRLYSVTNPPIRFVYLPVEAELATLVPPMAALPDTSASGGQFIATTDAGSGTATFAVNIPVAGVYLILCRVRSLDPSHASFVVSADDVALDILDASQGAWTYGWRWTVVNWPGGFKVSDSNDSTDTQTVFPFTVGQHRITFWGLEPDIGLDEILITNDRNSIRIRPVLTVPPDQSINELTTLVVTNTATDTNILANALSFSLVAAPTGVNLHPNTGVLTWTPTEAQGPSTNLITVRVTDDGSTPLSDTRSFTVVVNEVNSPPELMPVPDLTIRPGSRLIVTNMTYDPDIPPNILTISLGTGAPVGAAIDASNGLFTWQPTAAQADSTNTVTVWVTDDGSPPLSNSTTFRVIVTGLSPITLASLSLTNQQFRLGVSADSGISYSLQASTNLESWISLTTVNAADADFELVDTNAAAFPYRFYRVVIGP